jgi:hypothetical protein
MEIKVNYSVDNARLIADVLGRAHREAEDLHEPHEARVILNVVQLFADELAATDPRFDRLRFIRSAMEDGSKRA